MQQELYSECVCVHTYNFHLYSLIFICIQISMLEHSSSYIVVFK